MRPLSEIYQVLGILAVVAISCADLVASAASATLRREKAPTAKQLAKPDLIGLTERLGHTLEPFEHEYLTNLARAAGAELPTGVGQPGSPREVWLAFRDAMDSALNDTSLHLSEPLARPRGDDSIFVSIASYRDPSCSATVKDVYLRADRPWLVRVGVVQQNCEAAKGCFTGKGWASTRRWVPAGPDPDCLTEFCASALGRPHCEAERVRILRLPESEAYGPLFTRYLNAKLWRGETYFMQIDSHTGFREGWDTTMVSMVKRTPSFPRSVISSYPPSGTAEDSKAWARAAETGEPTVEGLCSAQFEDLGQETFTLRMGVTSLANPHARTGLRPPHAPFVAAGFLFAHSSFLAEVPPDPFLPSIFMGEEIAMSIRLWTSGYDIYAPSVNVVRHEYVRANHPKFWETVNMVFGGDFHNSLTALLIGRVLHLLGDSSVSDSVLTRASQYGLGTNRTRDQFMEMAGLDMAKKEHRIPAWCRDGTSPPYSMSG